jgi:ABC-type branched-subunit amino acid transport system ATPase component
VRSVQRTTQIDVHRVDSAPDAVLSVRNLVKRFGGQTVLNGVSVDLKEGEIVLLRGDNGAGKTTLLNILTGNLEPDQGTISVSLNSNGVKTRELFKFPHTFWTNLNPFNHFTPERIAREGVGRTWQELRLFTRSSLLNNIAVATPSQLGENQLMALMRRQAVRKQENEIQEQSKVMLWKLGLEGRENSSADSISLGQSKRVAIARAVQESSYLHFPGSA